MPTAIVRGLIHPTADKFSQEDRTTAGIPVANLTTGRLARIKIRRRRVDSPISGHPLKERGRSGSSAYRGLRMATIRRIVR